MSLSIGYKVTFLLGWKILICQKNHEGMEVVVWDGNFAPSFDPEAIKTISFIYEDLHIFIEEPY